jgi:hypothetical protein
MESNMFGYIMDSKAAEAVNRGIGTDVRNPDCARIVPPCIARNPPCRGK